MGLGLLITAPLPRNFSPKLLLDGVMRTLSAEFHPILRPGLSVAPQDDAKQLLVYAHPAEEPIFFNWDAKQLSASARTNGAGPGYHAWLVERLEAMETVLGVEWTWQDADGNPGDETEYHEHRDFARLQQSMLAWLKAISHNLAAMDRSGEYANIAISMPLETVVASEYFACSPLGFWERAFFQKIASAEIEQSSDAGAAFFPWWTRELDANFWRKHGLVYAWCHAPWHVADSEEETQAMNLALACFNKARELDPAIQLPDVEIAELKRLISITQSTNQEALPDPKLIGFKRRDNVIQLPGHWQIRLPGYFHSHWDSEKGTMTFYFNQRTIHITTYRVQHKSNHLPDLLGPAEKTARGSRLFEFGRDHLLGRAELAHQKDGTMYGYWTLTGKMVTAGAAAMFTICFDRQDDLDWANTVWQSLFKTPPQA